ncbi:MAG: acetyl-CoA C-acyltransferase, partial [Gammaproteobacteria bacterium]|nr:acetyl-CoA C-acyltransferase [Gammaproteobacteria bacterium]
MTMSENIVITGFARTPMGGFQGVLSGASAAELGAAAIKAAVERSQLQGDAIDEVIMGCVLPAGQGQAPARQASLGAGLPLATGCTTINKMCGSGMKATMFAHDMLKAGTNKVMVAGGLESMTNAPYLLTGARAGMRMGHGQVFDHMFLDGLEDAYDKGKLMGVFAEATADKYGFTRAQQDEFAITSLKRAQAAIESGAFKDEITPVSIKSRRGEVTVDTDEQPFNANIEKIPTLRAAFRADGTVTAANSSSISDGGAALVLMGESEAKR